MDKTDRTVSLGDDAMIADPTKMDEILLDLAEEEGPLGIFLGDYKAMRERYTIEQAMFLLILNLCYALLVSNEIVTQLSDHVPKPLLEAIVRVQEQRAVEAMKSVTGNTFFVGKEGLA